MLDLRRSPASFEAGEQLHKSRDHELDTSFNLPANILQLRRSLLGGEHFNNTCSGTTLLHRPYTIPLVD